MSEILHFRGVLELENFTSISTLVGAMKNKDMDMMWSLGKNFVMLFKASCMELVKRNLRKYMGMRDSEMCVSWPAI